MMKKIILMSSLLVLLITSVSASGFSPSSLVFEQKTGEKVCKSVTITSESSSISVSDKWAENKEIEWKVSSFAKDASSHGLTLTYPGHLTEGKIIEVCLSGSKAGEYHGVLLLTEEQNGNSIIQMGVWLKAVISGGNSDSSSSIQTPASSNSQQTNTNEIQELDSENSQTSPELEVRQPSGLTGGVIGGLGNNLAYIAIGFIGMIVLALAVVSIKNRRNKRWQN